MSSRASEARRGIFALPQGMQFHKCRHLPASFSCAGNQVPRSLDLARDDRLVPRFGQVYPLRIHSPDQCFLLASAPLFELFFPGNRAVNIVCVLIIHKLVDIVLLCKSVCQTIPVFIEPAGKIACNADIQEQNHTNWREYRRSTSRIPPHCTTVGCQDPSARFACSG